MSKAPKLIDHRWQNQAELRIRGTVQEDFAGLALLSSQLIRECKKVILLVISTLSLLRFVCVQSTQFELLCLLSCCLSPSCLA